MKIKLSALERFNEGGITGVVYAKKDDWETPSSRPILQKKGFILKD